MQGNENSSPVALIYDDDLIPFTSAFPEDLIGTVVCEMFFTILQLMKIYLPLVVFNNSLF